MSDTTAAPPQQLKRVLRVRDGLAVTVGIVIGAGILGTPGLIAGYLGDPWIILAMWFFGGVMAGLSQGGGVGLSLANSMTDGDPGFDIWGMDVARFGAFATPPYTRVKSEENYRRRFRITFPNEELPEGVGTEWRRLYRDHYLKGRLREYYDSLILGEEKRDKGLDSGRYVRDTRIRDWLENLDPGFPPVREWKRRWFDWAIPRAPATEP